MIPDFFKNKVPFFFKKILINFLLLKEGVVIKEAKNQEDLSMAYHFRWNIYTKEDYIDPADYPDKELKDKYDEFSINLLAIKNQKPVGAVRMVFFSQLGFPTANAFNFLNFEIPAKEVLEISKLCVIKEYRKTIVTLGLLKKAYEYSKEKKINYWLMGMPPRLKDRFSKFNVKFKSVPIQPPEVRHIEERKTAKKYFQKLLIQPYLLNLKEFDK